MTRTEFLVVPVEVVIEAIRVPGGHMIALELAAPRQKHAVMAHQPGGDPEVITMCDSREDAEAALHALLSTLAGEPAAGGRMQ